MNRITVVVEGGVIQNILDIPEGVEVLTKDYDCDEDHTFCLDEECVKDSNVKIDEDGNSYWECVWSSENCEHS
jgi:hypothetical protein